jgi:hypothetical protein
LVLERREKYNMKRIETGKWCISNDGELYNADDYDTKEDAIEGARRDYEYTNFYVAKVVNLEFDENDVIGLAENAYESLSEQLYEEVGEVAENWDTSIPKEAFDELDQLLSNTVIEWVNKNNLQPKCFGITGEYKI